MKRTRLFTLVAAAFITMGACQQSPSAPEPDSPSAPTFDGGSGGSPNDSTLHGGHVFGSGG